MSRYQETATQELAKESNQPIEKHSHENRMIPSQSQSLIHELCRLLEIEKISYCHWKSNNAIDRSETGENDLDLLVHHGDIQKFTKVLFGLGFKQAIATPMKQMPGVLDYFGFDSGADNFIHVHAHYQLIVGHDMTKNFHLPIEISYLESSLQGEIFKYADPTFEYIVFIIRMILKHSTWDAILGREGKLNKAERQELAYLQSITENDRTRSILEEHLPYIGIELFMDCISVLKPGSSLWYRIKTGQNLQSRLQSHARRPIFEDTIIKNWRRVKMAFRRRIFHYKPKYRLESGGAMIAIVGGDGAGKTTAIDGISGWLGKKFELSRYHMGKPPWSSTTIFIRSLLKIGNLLGLYPEETTYRLTFDQKSFLSPGYPWLLREVCRARDRLRIFKRARRQATNGGLVILDRFPLPQIKLMDGPLATQFMEQLAEVSPTKKLLKPNRSSALVKWLTKLEKDYYQNISSPEIVFVLRVDPSTAASRKVGEDLVAVRERSKEIWEQNWNHTGVNVIDSGQPKEEVLSQLKSIIWSAI